MMELTVQFLDALYDLSNAMAPYIIFGLFFAGILHEIVPETLVSKHLGKESIGSVIKATIFGVPLPVCSCGVIPLATSIKKSGSSNGATLSFLISTPITGVDSILATYGMFGWAFTIYRVLSSIVISIVAGIFTNIFTKEEPKPVVPAFSIAQPVSVVKMPKQKSVKKSFSFKRALKYAFITLLGDIATPLLWGLLIGAVISIAVPQNLSEILIEYSWLSYLIVILIAVPMYVCATASLPIAAGLILAGVTPGAAFVFLTAGPATNTVTIGVVKKMLGNTALYIYLSTIVIGSFLFGFVMDAFFDDLDIVKMLHLHEEASIAEIISSGALWIMVVYLIVKPKLYKV